MALINCPDCARQVSDKASGCPNCGHPLIAQSQSVSTKHGNETADVAPWSSMEPRSFLGTWVTIFAFTALPFGLGMVALMGALFGGSNPVMFAVWIVSGLAFGGFFGLCMAPLVMGIKVVMPFATKAEFVSRMMVAMAEVAYHLKSSHEDYFVFEAASGGRVNVGAMSLTPAAFFTVVISLGPRSATIVGPRYTVNRVRRRLI